VKYAEAEMQAAILRWFNTQYPQYQGLLVGYPAGLNLNLKTRVRMKATGLTPGFPDLQLLIPGALRSDGKISPGLFLELKTVKGRVSEVQKEYHDKLSNQDYTVVICRSFYEAVDWIKSYLSRVGKARP
jgi:hypothetical protein